MQRPQASLLADGRRLHLHHGPIDLVIETFGQGQSEAYRCVTQRFASVLDELVAELPLLRSRALPTTEFSGVIARRMHEAVEPYCSEFVTPMAAVAGAVADEMLSHIRQVPNIEKAYVNNGGDVAFHLTAGQSINAAMAALPEGQITVDCLDSFRGIATSGWSGRSFSLGIADSVSVVAKDAAAADVAATMIANAVKIPDHPNVTRIPANQRSPDTDLGSLEVTTHVGDLTMDEVQSALDNGMKIAQSCLKKGLIGGAVLQLKQELRQVGMPATVQTYVKSIPERELTDA